MKSRLFAKSPINSRTIARKAEIRAIVLGVVEFYQEQYRKAKIEPGGARWRELRFSFPRHAAEAYSDIEADDLWDELAYLVKCGCIKEYRTIFYPRYVIDYPTLRAFESKWNWA